MTDLTLWKILAAIAVSPSALIVLRALATRFSAVWKARVSEVDHLRAECAREREERHDETVELRRELEELRERKDAMAERYEAKIDKVIDERDRLLADLRVASHDLETARKFVAGATTTRKEGR